MGDTQGKTMPDEPRECASEVWSRRSGSNERPGVYEDQTQAMAPTPPPPNPANRTARQRDSPPEGLHSIALSMTGLRVDGYKASYIVGYAASLSKEEGGVFSRQARA
jgi:hypothetical protein